MHKRIDYTFPARLSSYHRSNLVEFVPFAANIMENLHDLSLHSCAAVVLNVISVESPDVFDNCFRIYLQHDDYSFHKGTGIDSATIRRLTIRPVWRNWCIDVP